VCFLKAKCFLTTKSIDWLCCCQMLHFILLALQILVIHHIATTNDIYIATKIWHLPLDNHSIKIQNAGVWIYVCTVNLMYSVHMRCSQYGLYRHYCDISMSTTCVHTYSIYYWESCIAHTSSTWIKYMYSTY